MLQSDVYFVMLILKRVKVMVTKIALRVLAGLLAVHLANWLLMWGVLLKRLY